MNKDSNGTMLTSRAFARLLALVLAVATVAVYTLPVSVIGSSGGSAPQDTGAATAAPQGEEQTEQALHTVLFNLPEGYAYEDGTTTFSLLVKDGNVVPQGGIPAAPAARDGYAFAGWKIVSGDGTSEILTPEAITTKNVTLDTLYTAVYDKAENVSEESGEEAASEDTDAAPAEEAKPADDAAAEDTPAADETADPAAAEGEAPVEGETPAEDALTDEEAAAAAEAAAAEESGKTKSGIEPMAAYTAGSWTALKTRVETNGGTNGSVAGDVITLNGDAYCQSNTAATRVISVTKDLTIIGKQGSTQHYFAGNNANNPAYFDVAAGVTLTLQDTQVLDNTFYVTGAGKVVFKGTTDWRGKDVDMGTNTGLRDGAINTAGVEFDGGTHTFKANITGGSDVYGIIKYTADTDWELSVKNGAKVLLDNVSTTNTNTLAVQVSSSRSAKVTVDGAGSELKVIGYGKGTGEEAGTMNLKAGKNSGFWITNGGKAYIRALGGIGSAAGGVDENPVVAPISGNDNGQTGLVLMMWQNGELNVDGLGSLLDVESYGASNGKSGGIWFRNGVGTDINPSYETAGKFVVSNRGEVRVINNNDPSSNTRDAAAIRFGAINNDAVSSGQNEFTVSGGGRLYVENTTTGDGGGNRNGRNAAIEFESGHSVFTITGYKSTVVAKSNRGPAINNSTNGGDRIASTQTDVKVADQGVFIADGQTYGSDASYTSGTDGIFITYNNFTFEVDNPLYYDFLNHKSGGGKLLHTNVAGSISWWSKNSDVAVWNIGTDVNGTPTSDWTQVEYKLSGQDGGTNTDTSQLPANASTSMPAWTNLANYTRVTGDNAVPTIKVADDLTNADKYVRNTGVVFSGSTLNAEVPPAVEEQYRAIYDDEVHARWKVKQPGETTWSADLGKGFNGSKLKQTVYTAPTSKELTGIVWYNYAADTSNANDFLVTGQEWKISRAWRGDTDEDTGNSRHEALNDGSAESYTDPGSAGDTIMDPTKALADETAKVVKDVTPPAPAVVTSTDEDTSTTGIQVYPGSTLTGTYLKEVAQKAAVSGSPEVGPWNPEPATKARLVKADGTVVAGPVGVTATGLGTSPTEGIWELTVPNDIPANTDLYVQLTDESADGYDGVDPEWNPITATQYHDTTFPAAAKITVLAAPYRDLVYNLNAPAGTPSPSSIATESLLAGTDKISEATGYSTTVTLTGYDFAGWYYDAACSDTSTKPSSGPVGADDLMTTTGNTTGNKTTIYAKWTVGKGTITGVLYEDADWNDTYASGTETPLKLGSGLVVELWKKTGANWAPVLDASNNPVTTTTDANGVYKFTGLDLDTPYGVKFPTPFLWKDAGNGSANGKYDLGEEMALADYNTSTQYGLTAAPVSGEDYLNFNGGNGIVMTTADRVKTVNRGYYKAKIAPSALNFNKAVWDILSPPAPAWRDATRVTQIDQILDYKISFTIPAETSGLASLKMLDNMVSGLTLADGAGNLIIAVQKKTGPGANDFEPDTTDAERAALTTIFRSTDSGADARSGSYIEYRFDAKAIEGFAAYPAGSRIVMYVKCVLVEIPYSGEDPTIVWPKVVVNQAQLNVNTTTVNAPGDGVPNHDYKSPVAVDSPQFQFQKLPLVIPAEDASRILTKDDLIAEMTVSDDHDTLRQGDDPLVSYNDVVLEVPVKTDETRSEYAGWDDRTFTSGLHTPVSVTTVGGAPIDASIPGVYIVRYTATDQDGHTGTATRPVVIQDGRYTFPDVNNADDNEQTLEDEYERPNDGIMDRNGAIIGAKNFIATQSQVDGSASQARSFSYAEAYDNTGAALAVTWKAVPKLDGTGANYNALPTALGDYPDFVWIPANTAYKGEKQITGTVLSDDYTIDPGNKASQYALAAKDFEKTVAEARAMENSGNLNGKILEAADAQSFILVDNKADGTPRDPATVSVVSNAGFSHTPADYDPITFKTDKYSYNELGVAVTGTVSDIDVGDAPIIYNKDDGTNKKLVPIEIPYPNSYGAGDLTDDEIKDGDPADPADDLKAEDAEDNSDLDPSNDIDADDVLIKDPATGDPAQVPNEPGLYPVILEVTDSDGNTTSEPIVVCVNDGTYTVGEGRILEAHSFVVTIDDATGSDAEILSLSEAKLYNGKTGAQIGADAVTVGSKGGYPGSPTVGEYPIEVLGADDPSGTITRQITGKVVDADEINHGPDDRDVGDSIYYVYGNNKVYDLGNTPDYNEVGTLTSNAAILTALDAHGNEVKPDTTIANANVEIESITDDTNAAITSIPREVGTYKVVVRAVAAPTVKVTLTITINDSGANDHVPLLGNKVDDNGTTNDPSDDIYEMQTIAVPATETPGTLTDAQIKNGDPNTDHDDMRAWDAEDGNLKSAITIVDIKDEDGNPVSSVPSDEGGVYLVTFEVKDSGRDLVPGNTDDNTVQKTGVLVVDDGTIAYDDKYVVKAESFLIGVSQVTPNDAENQILDKSGAKAWNSTNGTETTPIVSDTGGYTNTVRDYYPQIEPYGYPDLFKQITAKVWDDVTNDVVPDDPAAPGDTDGPDGPDTKVDEGDEYSIMATDFRISRMNAAELAQTYGTNAYNAGFISNAAAQGFLRKTGLTLSAVALVDDGSTVYVQKLSGDAASPDNFKDADDADDFTNGDIYTATFQVLAEPTTQVTIKVLIEDGNAPNLIVPPIKSFDLDHVITDAEYREGVSATDAEDGNIPNADPVPPAKQGISYDDSAVDIHKRGMYEVEYTATDSEGNETTKSGWIAIDMIVVGNYAAEAFDFVKIIDKVHGGDAEILTASNAKAWHIDPDTNEREEIDSLVLDDADYPGSPKAVGDYAPIKIGVEEVTGDPFPSDHPDGPVAEINGKIIDRDHINNPDGTTPDKELPDSDGDGVPDREQGTPDDADGDGIPNDTDPDDDNDGIPDGGDDTPLGEPNAFYKVAANDVNLDIIRASSGQYAGPTDAVKALLISDAFYGPSDTPAGDGTSEPKGAAAVAFQIDGDKEGGAIDTKEWDVDVKSNDIPVSPTPGRSYEVVFTPKGVPSVEVKVKFHMSNGMPPVITFTQDPLVVARTDTHVILTDDDLKAKLELTDREEYPTWISDADGKSQPLWDDLTATPVNLPEGVDTYNVGVYKVKYEVTDADGNTTTEYRAVVVQDGRYEIPTDDPTDDGDNQLDPGEDGVCNDIIIGARDYVIAQENVQGTIGEARSQSYAEAFDVDGNQLVPLSLKTGAGRQANGLPNGYVVKAELGEYEPFEWQIEGHTTTKSIKATVVGNDYVGEGDKNSQYSIVADDFMVWKSRAQEMVDWPQSDGGLSGQILLEANVGIYPLTPDAEEAQNDPATEKHATVLNNGGFKAEKATYPMRYGVEGVPPSEMKIDGVGVVMDGGTAPTIAVDTPVEIWIGAPADKATYASADAYDPGQFDLKDGVTAYDADDGPLAYAASPSAATPGFGYDPTSVDETTPGLYKFTYTAVDSDGNTAETTRIVCVNDGRYKVGESRILEAQPFVVKAEDVGDAPYDEELLSRSGATLYDGATGDPIDATSVDDDGDYGPAPGEYDVVIAGEDPSEPTGEILKPITAKVVDADEIDKGPDDPGANEPTYYVYGNHIEYDIDQPTQTNGGKTLAQLVASAAPYADVLTALGAGGSAAYPPGNIEDADISVVSITPAIANAVGTYTVIVKSDDEPTVQVTLTIKVVKYHAPDIFTDKDHDGTPDATDDNDDGILDPIELPKSETPGNLTADDILADVGAYDEEDNNDADPDNDITADDVEIVGINDRNGDPITTDADGDGVPDVPADERGVYQVVLEVGPDEDGNTTTDKTALVVGDIDHDDEYYIDAKSFVIGVTKVDEIHAKDQILEYGEAGAWTKKGDPAATYVRETGGYKAVIDDYAPIVGIVGHDALTKTILARVIDDRSDKVIPGDPSTDDDGDGTDADDQGGPDTKYENGDEYTIQGTDFRLTEAAANALKAKYASDKPAYIEEIKTKGAAKGFVRTANDLLAIEAEKIGLVDDATSVAKKANWNDANDNGVVDSGELSTTGAGTLFQDATFAEGDIFVATFYIVPESDTKVTINILVSRGGLPVIDADDKTIERGATDAELLEELFKDVTATDPEQGTITDDLIIGKWDDADGDGVVDDGEFLPWADKDGVITAANNPVDTSTTGPNEVTYSVTDEDGNTVYKTITATVNKGQAPKITFSKNPLEVYSGDDDGTNRGRIIDHWDDKGTPDDDTDDEPVFTGGETVVYVPLYEVYVTDKEDTSDAAVLATVWNANHGTAPAKEVTYKAVGPAVDTAKVGVYMVSYDTADKDGNDAETAQRLVLVNDGRYRIADGLILGARSFVIPQAEVDGSEGQARAKSYAEAYDARPFLDAGPDGELGTADDTTPNPNFGDQVPVHWTGAPAGYVAGAEPDDYPITWTVPGWPDYDGDGQTPKKDITATVSDADVVDPGDKYSKYALTANHFRKSDVEAQAMIDSGDLNAAILEAADATVYKLVSTAEDKDPVVTNNGGFGPTPKDYNIRIAVDGVPETELGVQVIGTVYKEGTGGAPTLDVDTPINIEAGTGLVLDSDNEPIDPPTTYSDLYGVEAANADGDDITSLVVATPIEDQYDVDEPGLYPYTYSVTDNKGTPTDPSDDETTTAPRVVVVNDGRYTVDDGRILEAHSFVTKIDDVTTDPMYVDAELLNKSEAKLYDGKTAAPIDGLTVEENAENYPGPTTDGVITPTEGEYDVVIGGRGETDGTVITKAITAKVVDADEINDGPGTDPSNDNFIYYVYGNNIVISQEQARDIINGTDNSGSGYVGADENARILYALGAAGDKTNLEDNSITSTPVAIADNGVQPAFDWAIGDYVVTVWASEEHTVTVDLTITVAKGYVPDIFTDKDGDGKPDSWDDEDGDGVYDDGENGDLDTIEIPTTEDGGNLTPEDILEGIGAYDPEDGNLSDDVEITDVKDEDGNPVPDTDGDGFPDIPSDERGVYPITLEVTDDDGNTTTEDAVLVVNDGTIIVDDEYVLMASSFIIGVTEVDILDKDTQILEKSEAKAWTKQGHPATPVVNEYGGYTNVKGEYFPLIGIQNYAPVWKQIEAKVIDGTEDGSDDGDDDNGDGDSDDPGDGHYDNGDVYSILAYNFRINLADADALADTYGTDAYEEAFIEKAAAVGFLRRGNALESGGTVKLTDSATSVVKKGGTDLFQTATFAEGDLFLAKFYIDEEPDTNVTITVLVSNGGVPSIYATDKTVEPRVDDTPLTWAEFMDRDDDLDNTPEVQATDPEQGTITDDVIVGKWVDTDGDGIVDEGEFLPFVDKDGIIDEDNNPLEMNVPGKYPVTYAVTDDEGNTAYKTVEFKVGRGDGPVITPQRYPLIIEQTPASRIVPDEELKDYLEVTDAQDYPTWNSDEEGKAQALYTGMTVNPSKIIDSHNIGVYRVEYTATDSTGNSTTYMRLVVVQDGRYVIPGDNNGDGDNNDEGDDPIMPDDSMIIGARNFIVNKKLASGTEDEARSLSYAEAFAKDGTQLQVKLIGTLPDGYKNLVVNFDPEDPEANGYPFKWGVTGYDEEKDILGWITDGEVIDPDGKNSQHAIVASDFEKTIAEANAMVKSGNLDGELIKAAGAVVKKLVELADDASPVVKDNGGFRAVRAGYPITFTAKYDNGDYAGQAVPELSVKITGLVKGGGEAPVLTVPTPIEVEIATGKVIESRDDNGTADPSDDIITYADGNPVYTPMYQVTAYDEDDGFLTDRVEYEAVGAAYNVNTEGLYKVKYSVKDLDDNVVEATRIIVVNDTTYTVGKGRILEAHDFTAKLSEVTPDGTGALYEEQIRDEVKSRAGATLYDGETGQIIDLVSVDDLAGYHAAAGVYKPIVFSGVDPAAEGGKIEKRVTGTVEDDGPPPPPRDPHYPDIFTDLNHDGEPDEVDDGGTPDDPSDDNGILKPIVIPQDKTGDTVPIEAIKDPLGASDPEDGDLTDDIKIGDDPTQDIDPEIDITEKGVYPVEVTVQDSEGHTTTEEVPVIVDDGSIEFDDKYAISAKSFIIGITEVDEPGANAQILAKSEAQAWKLYPVGDADPYVKHTGGYHAEERDYHPIIGIVGYAPLIKEITAKVIDGTEKDDPSDPGDDGDDDDGDGSNEDPGDGHYGNGDEYSILAYNFRVNWYDANAITALDDDAYLAKLIEKAEAVSYLRTGESLISAGTIELVTITNDAGPDTPADDDEFKGHGDFASADDPYVFSATFTVAEDPAAIVIFKIFVNNGAAPVIYADPKVIPLGTPKADIEGADGILMDGVTATDKEDGDLTDDVDLDSHTVPFTSDKALTPGEYTAKYTVTDRDRNQTEKTVKVTVDDGETPIINFQRVPLVFDQTESSAILTDAQLTQAMTVYDKEDTGATEISAEAWNALNAGGQQTDVVVTPDVGSIDTANVGVYRVAYKVTDYHGNSTTKYRPVVVQDGRYIIPGDNDGDGDNEDPGDDPVMDDGSYIIGARDFVVKKADVKGDEAQARSLSYAEAFDKDGQPATVKLAGEVPDGFKKAIVNYVEPYDNPYNFTWIVVGDTKNGQKAIKGWVTDADVLDPGDKDSKYAVMADNFIVTVAQAANIQTTADYVAAANARAAKLVDTAPDPTVILHDKGGFKAVEASYNIKFGVKPEGKDIIPESELCATIVGRVYDKGVPEITVPGPIEILIDEADTNGLEWTQIQTADTTDTADDITAFDKEDLDLTAAIKITYIKDIDGNEIAATGANNNAFAAKIPANKPGIFVVDLEVTDSDGNKATNTAVVVLNGEDGPFVVEDGRILYAKSFVTNAKDVYVDDLEADVLNKSSAVLYDGHTGQPIDAVSVGGYGDNGSGVPYPGPGDPPVPTKDVYDGIEILGEGETGETLTKTITGEVVEADVIEKEPDPDPDPEPDPDYKTDDYYAFGNNIVVSPGDVRGENKIVGDEDDMFSTDTKILTALDAGARKVDAQSGDVTDANAKIVSITGPDGNTYTAATFPDNVLGVFKVVIADSGDHVTAELTITVAKGGLPDIFTDEDHDGEPDDVDENGDGILKPVEVDPEDYVDDGGTPDDPSDDKISIPVEDILEDIGAKDPEDGDLSDDVVVTDVKDDEGNSIPKNDGGTPDDPTDDYYDLPPEDGVYKVEFEVEDSDGNKVPDETALIVGDLPHDDNYIIDGNSFIIGVSKVNVAGAKQQILEKSAARAWTTKGDKATPIVAQTAGYTNVVADYNPILGIDGYAALTKSITARVIDDVTDTVVPGDDPDDPDDTNGPGGPDQKYEEGDKYALVGKDISINLKDALALQQKAPKSEGKGEGIGPSAVASFLAVKGIHLMDDASDYLDEFIKRAAVASYLKKDPSFKPAGTIVLDSVVKSGNWNDADKDGILDEGELDTTEKGLSFADATLALFDIFEVTFHVSEDPTATITVSMLITNGTPPTLVVPEHRHYERGEFTDANYMDGVYAYDNEDDDSQLVISVLNKIVDPNVEDVYVIYYTVEDTDGNITPGSGAISIGGVVDEDYWINAKDFTKKLVADNVQGTAEEAIRWSEAIGKYVGTNTETLKKGDVVPVIVADLGGYKKAAGVYNIKYAVEAHQAAAITKKATITDDSEPIIEEPIPLAAPPTLVVPDVRQYDLGAFTDANYMDGVTASDAVDGDLTAKVTYDKPVKPNKADAYVVTYSVTNSANLSATKTGVILIGDWVVKGGYGLYAQDFKAKLSKIEGTKAEAIELAKAKAIDLRRQVEEGSDDGTKLLAVGALAMVDNDRYGKELKVTVDDAGGYKKAAGKYKITFKIYGLTSKDAPAKKVTATITDDSKKPATTTTSGGGGGGGTAKTGDDMMLELLILLLILSAAAMVCIYLRKRQGDAQEA